MNQRHPNILKLKFETIEQKHNDEVENTMQGLGTKSLQGPKFPP